MELQSKQCGIPVHSPYINKTTDFIPPDHAERCYCQRLLLLLLLPAEHHTTSRDSVALNPLSRS